MEAKDTVMSRPMDLGNVYMGNEIAYTSLGELLEAQTEITHKVVLEEVGKWLNDKHLTSVYDAFMRKFS